MPKFCVQNFILLIFLLFPFDVFPQQMNFTEILSNALIEEQHASKLVGMGAIVMQNAALLGQAVTGERKINSGIELSIDDQWHIGSVTKSITATLAARLIEQGLMDWDTPLAEIFTDHDIHPEWQAVTVEQLLTHTSGARPNFSIFTNFSRPDEGEQRMQARLDAVLSVLRSRPNSAPGESFNYSNVGYTIVGVIAEELTEKPWEELLRQHVFSPLGLDSAGFGPPIISGAENDGQPEGHRRWLSFGPKVAVGTGTFADNSPIIGPAGSVHMSLVDLAKYAQEHLFGAKGKGNLLDAKSYQQLQTASLENYASGWVVTPERKWADGPLIWHNGSNTMWYALMVIIPVKDLVIVVTANDGDIDRAESAAWKLVQNVTKLLDSPTQGVPE